MEVSQGKEKSDFEQTAVGELEKLILQRQMALQQVGLPGFFPSKTMENLTLQAKILQIISFIGLSL